MNKLNLFLVALLLLAAGTWAWWPPVDQTRWNQIVAGPGRPQARPNRLLTNHEISAFGLLERGQNGHLRQLLGEGDADLNRAVAAFARTYPGLHRQLQDPGFQVTQSDLKALSAYSEVLTLQNRPQAAQAVGLDCLRAGLQCLPRADLFQDFNWRIRSQAQALSTIELLLARTDWTGPQLAELTALLKNRELASDCVAEDLKNQMRLFESGAMGHPPSYLQIPFGVDHHRRIYQNQSLEILRQLESGVHLQDSPARREHSLWSDSPDPCLGNPARAQRQLVFTRQRQQLDLQWAEALTQGRSAAVGAPLEEWLHPELERTSSGCWILRNGRMQLAPWCIRSSF
ncbi:MAG: hypothetical protein U0931_11785 [Vulcanimicrobiota bacterium]